MLSEYLKENCEVQLHYNGNTNKIIFSKLNKSEIIFNHQIPLENLNFGLSVTCIFKYDEKNIRFNAKIKHFDISKLTLFLIGEEIIDNERNYLRIEDTLEFFYQKIEMEDIDFYTNKVYQNYNLYNDTDYIINRSDPYYKVFKHLIDKINNMSDMISHLVNKLENVQEKEFTLRKANISASGLKFQTEDNYSKGNLIFIKFKLKSFQEISIIGEVLNVTPINNGLNEIIIEFRLVDAQAKEKMLQYVIQKDRQLNINKIK